MDAGDHETLVAYAFSLYLRPRGRGGSPVATATRDADGVVLRVAPVDTAPLTVDLRYAAPLTIHDGRARLVIPAAGADPRLAPTEVALASADLAEASVGGLGAHAILASSSEVSIEARVASPIAALHRRGAGAGTTVRGFAVAPRVVVSHDVILAVDVSPSTEEVPTGRLEAALRATLAALPEGTLVRVLRFGARAEWASADGRMPAWRAPREIEPSAILDVGFGALGSRTLYPPIAQRIDESLVDAMSPLVIILGDGWLSAADFTAVASAGARVVVVDVGDEPFAPDVNAAVRTTPGTLALRVGPSLAGRDGTPVSAIVAEPAAPIELRDGAGDRDSAAASPSGEPFVIDFAGSASMSAFGGGVSVIDAPWSVLPRELGSSSIALDPRIWGDIAKFDRGGPMPSRVPGGLGGIDDAITGAAYVPASAADGAFMAARAPAAPRMRVCQASIRSVLSPGSMRGAIVRALRARARGCFAEARHGRPSWSARAEVRLVLGHREVLAGTVTGTNVDAALAACIERGFELIQVPSSDSTVTIDYPFVSPPFPPTSAPIPLDPALRETLDAITGPFDAQALDAEARALVSR